MRLSHSTDGFTLIELSIVLVIVGLLVGGVLVGQELIHQAALRKVVSQVTEYRTAVNTFYGKYNAIPGDMPNAFAIWGTACDDLASNCNGNGNGSIEWNPAGAGYNIEPIKAWLELYLAGLIRYKVLADYTTSAAGVPAPINNAGWAIKNGSWNDVTDGSFYAYYGKTGNGFDLEGPYNADTTMGANGGVSPQDAQAIDSKMDDGIASGGMVRPGVEANGYGPGGGGTLCATPNAFSTSGSYNTLTVTDPTACRLHFFWDQ